MTKVITEKTEAVPILNTTEPYHTRGEIENLVAALESCTMPKPYWTHQAHLTASMWYNLRYNPEEALNVMREAILRYNESTGTKQTPTGGYHETMTIFWMWAVRKYISSQPVDAS